MGAHRRTSRIPHPALRVARCIHPALRVATSRTPSYYIPHSELPHPALRVATAIRGELSSLYHQSGHNTPVSSSCLGPKKHPDGPKLKHLSSQLSKACLRYRIPYV